MRRLPVALAYGSLAVAVAALGGYLAVSLLVQRSPEVEVPEVTGRSLSEALDEVRGVGLDLEVRDFVYSDEVPENRIVRQRPPPGQVVKSGRGVGVVLSRGPESHATPDVRGTFLDDARILLEEASLKGAVAARMGGGLVDEVLAQGVEPGRRLRPESTVPLVVSSGAPPVLLRMPRLERLGLDQALDRVDRLGLRVGRIEEVSLEDPTRQGRVVSQEPLPGFPVTAGESVTLSVAGSARTAVTGRGVWLSHSLPPGFARHRVEVVLERSGQAWILADEWLGGGEVFRRWVILRPGETARLQINGEEIERFDG